MISCVLSLQAKVCPKIKLEIPYHDFDLEVTAVSTLKHTQRKYEKSLIPFLLEENVKIINYSSSPETTSNHRAVLTR